MPIIETVTEIKAPIERCFLLSLSVDLHTQSTSQTNEKAVAGVTTGTLKLNDTVTWRAKHFGIYQNLTSKITAYTYPYSFIDEMVKGPFKRIHHQHLFEQKGEIVLMKDSFEFEAPLGLLGKLFSMLILKGYLQNFLNRRNAYIKKVAEGEEWKDFVPHLTK